MLGALKQRVVKGLSSGFPPQKKGVGLLVVAILIWGGNWPVMKTGLAHIDPFWFATVRFVLGMTCLFALQIATKNLKVPASRDLPVLISVGLLQMLAFTLLVNYALLTADAGHSA
ncbi:EamA family transporter, partial [Eoetvoesiella caeni]